MNCTLSNDTLLPFTLPAIGGKKITGGFDSGRLSSDGGVLLLSPAEQQLGLCEMLVGLILDHREEERVPAHLRRLVRRIHRHWPNTRIASAVTVFSGLSATFLAPA